MSFSLHSSPLPRTDRAPWVWAMTGVISGSALALVCFAPARWLTQSLEAASNARLSFSDVRGSVWQGSAQLSLTGGPGSSDASALPGRVGWNINTDFNGLRLGLALVVQAPCCMQTPMSMHITPGLQGLQLQWADHASAWPASWLSGLGTPWNTIRAEGQLALQTTGLGLQWSGNTMVLQGQAHIDAHDMSSRLSTLRPMGSYRLTLLGGKAAQLELTTLQGSLVLSGKGQWKQGKLRFTGEALAAPERMDALSNLLNIIGQRQGARSIITVG
jgi:general secretion pathway protein N